MSLAPGRHLGPYEIVTAIGAGGMGEVYKARDTRLNRTVAVKVLPPHFSENSEMKRRFEREAQTLASLSHPHICPIFDIGQKDGVDYLVMEYLEGQTVAQRLEKSALPLDEALKIGTEIADALDKAHRQGITHRDLKPANVMLTKSGSKLMDFGLAKLRQPQSMSSFSSMPTNMGVTAQGTILGTLQYMSPEQLEGNEADARADIFAFGAVIYEMVTGKKAFEGKSQASLISAIMSSEPMAMSSLQEMTPPALERAVKKCLAKDPEKRWQTAADLADQLTWIVADGAMRAAPALRVALRKTRERVLWALLAIVTSIAAVLGVVLFRPLPSSPEMRLEISAPATADPVSLAISPDGQKIVFLATSEGKSQLWLRSLDSVSARPLAGTDGASFPFWSPDNRSIGFFADGKLKRIDVDSSSVQILADAASGGRGGSWNREGTIIFTPSAANSPIFRISAAGGTPSPVTRTEAKETNHRFPYFLPDGNHFLYYVQGTPESHGIYLNDLNGSQARRLLDVDSAPVYTSSGQLLFVRQGTLFAQEFDATRLELKGSPFSVADHIARGSTAQGAAAVSASLAGPLVYRTDSGGGRRQFVWFDRSGKEIGKAGDSVAALELSISPDGRRASLAQFVNQNLDVWLLDLERGVLSRFTSDPAVDNSAVWSPDGRRIAFESNRKGVFDLYQKPAAGPGSEELLLASPQPKGPLDWSPDGRFLLYFNLNPEKYHIWALPLEGDRKPFPVTQTNFNERSGQFSPDGKWIAYESDESGRYEIYVQPFPGPGGKVQVSTNGGAQVRWRRDGKELFYVALDSRLMAVPLRLASNVQTIDAATPVPLFVTHIGGAISVPFKQQYDVSPDGQRFLMNTIAEEATSPITVILNWKPKR